jgi:hypothetical protein
LEQPSIAAVSAISLEGALAARDRTVQVGCRVVFMT